MGRLTQSRRKRNLTHEWLHEWAPRVDPMSAPTRAATTAPMGVDFPCSHAFQHSLQKLPRNLPRRHPQVVEVHLSCFWKRPEIRFRGVRFQTPNSVSFSGLSEFRGANSVSSFKAYYLCVNANSPSSSQNSPSLPQNSVRLSEFSSPKQYSRNSFPPVSYVSTCSVP